MSDKKVSPSYKYRAVIIGAGRIGATFDTPESKEVLTHAHGYTKHESTHLVGFYDKDTQKSATAASLWGGESFPSLQALLEQGKPDIVSICTPDEDHLPTLEQVILHKPRLIVCEKPVTMSVRGTERIMQLAREKRVPISVNYSRRFDSSIEELRKAVQRKIYGKVLLATSIYTRGILHNGSHVIDLARFLFGEVQKITPLYVREDYLGSDKSVAAYLEFEHCPQFHLIVGDARHYAIMELDILFERKRWRFVDFGFRESVQEIRKDPRYPDFVKSLHGVYDGPTCLGQACTRMVDNAVSHLVSKEPLLCDIEDALKTQRVCETLSAFT